MANAVANSEIDRKEQAWAREERGAATRGAGTEVRAVAAKAGRVARRNGKKNGSRSVRSSGRIGKRNGSKIVRNVGTSGSKNAARSAETAPVETGPGGAKPGRVVYAPPRS